MLVHVLLSDESADSGDTARQQGMHDQGIDFVVLCVRPTVLAAQSATNKRNQQRVAMMPCRVPDLIAGAPEAFPPIVAFV